jgi:tellurite resistance protein TehA-like permease
MRSILQAGGILSPELVIIALIAVVLFAIPLVVSLLIYRDAKSRESTHPVAWASASFFCASLGSFFAGLVFWVFYLVVRDEIGPDTAPAGASA